MKDKEAKTVATNLDLLFQQTGPIKILQCDNGTEFFAEAIQLVADWGIPPIINSSTRHPQTNGVAERNNGMLKDALEDWMQQEKNKAWHIPLSRIVYQINCVAPRTTKISPYKLKNAMKPPDWEGMNWVEPLPYEVVDQLISGAASPERISRLASEDTAAAGV